MDPNSLDSGSDHVVDITSQEQESNIPSNSGLNTASEPIESEHDLGITSREHTSVELPTCKTKADRSLLNGSKEEYMGICVPLYEAAITGDWEAAKVILDERPELVKFAITPNGDTTLHIAIRAEATKQSEIFVENLLTKMDIEDLGIGNDVGEPAYKIAAIKGKVKMVKLILNKHNGIFTIFPSNTLTALNMSAQNGNHDMTLHLYNVLETASLSFWGEDRWCKFFLNCIHGDLFGIALKVLEDHQSIGTSTKTCFQSLDTLARKPDTINRTEIDTYRISRIADSILAFFHVKKNSPEMDNQALKLVRRLLELYPIEVKEKGMNPSRLLFTAAEMSNTRFVIELLRMFPTTIHDSNDDKKSIFHIAIMSRNKDIYNLVYETGSQNSRIARWLDKEKNNILHLVAITSNNKAQHQMESGASNNKAQHQMESGASLLMQRELLWYKEVEKMVPPTFRNAKNRGGKTPYEIFSENNKDLVSKGLKWTRDCMVVATLIITVSFAVAFTVPGGYNQHNGIPLFYHDTSFLVFVIADAFSLFTSSTSLLVFLFILTSPHGQRDFLYAMPGKLMIGLVTLFMSVAAMMVTFAASFFVIYQNTYKWLPILISVFAATPVIIFAALQYPFVMDMFRSMYDSRYLFNTGKRVLYNKNNRLSGVC